MRFPYLILCLLFCSFFGDSLFAETKRLHGWSGSSGSFKLMIDGNEAMGSREGYRFQSPTNLTTNQEIDYYLSLGELYLRRKDKVGVANILYDLRVKKGDYVFADAILTSLWKQAQGDDTQAVKVLDSYIQKEPNTYFRNLAKNMRTNLYQEGEDEKKDMIAMDCIKSKPYYSLCRVFRLQYYIDLPRSKDNDIHKHYVNVMRVASPFFEDSLLEWVPLLEWIDEDLPSKLAFLGFIREATYLQNMIMDLERVSDGEVSENSLERLSFFQVLAGDYAKAEESLIQYLNITKAKKTSLTNRIFIKLGMLAYLQKNYKKSVDYYLKLDISNWTTNVIHPILNEPLSITGAKDLIAVSIWKSQGADLAIKALQKIQDPEKLSEDDIWPKLRMAQIMMDQNPELSSRITDEIVYMAQGKGWRRLEYAATVMQGYTQIYRKEFRRSTIELTKSRGILNPENQFYASEFIRNFGFVFAHTASGKRGPINGNIKEGLSDFRKQVGFEDLFYIRNYRPLSFPTELFFEYSINFLKEESDAWGLLDALFQNEMIKKQQADQTTPHSLSQIRFVDQKLKYLSGFQSPRESKFFDSTYEDTRQEEVIALSKLEEESVSKSLETAKSPVVFVLAHKDSTYLFFYNPKEPKKTALTWKEIKTTRIESIEITESIKDFHQLTKEIPLFQFYFNEAGFQSHRLFRRDVKDRETSLFGLLHTSLEIPKSTNTITWDCPLKDKVGTIKGIVTVDRAYFEGSKILTETNRAHLWDFEPTSKKDTPFIEMSWACKSPEEPNDDVTLARLTRRLDHRTVPQAIVYSDKALGRSFQEAFSLHSAWNLFWLNAGARVMIYRPKMPYSEVTSGAMLSDPTFYREDSIFITQTPQ